MSFANFNVRKASPDGLCYKCRGCATKTLVEWRLENPDGFKDWYAENKEVRAETYKAYREQNKERIAASYAKWAKANKHIVNSLIAKRNAAKKQSTPLWADFDAIRAIYADAARISKETGIRHEVDHFYPLQGALVCGLHCAANLQIITEFENISKLNRMPEEFYEGRRNLSGGSRDGADSARVRVESHGAAGIQTTGP